MTGTTTPDYLAVPTEVRTFNPDDTGQYTVLTVPTLDGHNKTPLRVDTMLITHADRRRVTLQSFATYEVDETPESTAPTPFTAEDNTFEYVVDTICGPNGRLQVYEASQPVPHYTAMHAFAPGNATDLLHAHASDLILAQTLRFCIDAQIATLNDALPEYTDEQLFDLEHRIIDYKTVLDRSARSREALLAACE